MQPDEVSPERLCRHVTRLSYPRNRLDFAAAMGEAQQYVLDHWSRNGFRGDFSLLVHRSPGTRLARWLQVAFRTPALLLRDPADLPWIGGRLAARFPFVDHLARSDHAPFWRQGIPALMVTDTAEFRNAHYHQRTDLPETLDFQRMAEVVRATAGLVVEVAGRS